MKLVILVTSELLAILEQPVQLDTLVKRELLVTTELLVLPDLPVELGLLDPPVQLVKLV